MKTSYNVLIYRSTNIWTRICYGPFVSLDKYLVLLEFETARMLPIFISLFLRRFAKFHAIMFVLGSAETIVNCISAADGLIKATDE